VSDLSFIFLTSILSGSTIFLGGILSHFFGDYVQTGETKATVIHISIAFGGGLLLSAVGLVLVPEGMEVLSLGPVVLSFLAGTIGFFFLDQFVAQKGGKLAQLIGMLSDFIPQAIAMGAVLSKNPTLGILLAIMIGIQNFPEAFNAYLDLKTNYSVRKSLWILFILSFAGVFAALPGFYWLSEMPKVVASIMLFSGGGLIYLIFQDIAPMSKLSRSWIPALGASVGFLVGMISMKLLE
jgi:zinc transporter, ZIP family